MALVGMLWLWFGYNFFFKSSPKRALIVRLVQLVRLDYLVILGMASKIVFICISDGMRKILNKANFDSKMSKLFG